MDFHIVTGYKPKRTVISHGCWGGVSSEGRSPGSTHVDWLKKHIQFAKHHAHKQRDREDYINYGVGTWECDAYIRQVQIVLLMALYPWGMRNLLKVVGIIMGGG